MRKGEAFMRKIGLCFLSFVFVFVVCGCGSYYKVVDPVSKKVYFTDSIDQQGRGVIQFKDKLSKNLVTLPESKVMEITKDQYLAGAPVKATQSFPYCTEEDADWCGPCWNNPANTWCCKHRGGKDPNCGVDASTCKYCEGCHQGDDCINICTKPPKGAGGPTNIKITNATDKDVTIAFVTGASGGACKDVHKMISYQWIAENTTWCKNPQQEGGPNAGYCTGIVPKRSFVEVTRTGENALKCLTGSILLGGKLSCPEPTGFTQGEFTLNPTDTDTEAVDISLVNGVNYALTVNLPGKAWKVQDGGAAVTSIGPNVGFDGDNNKNGIFPPGCTDCVVAVQDRIPCPKITPNPKCQPTRICNIYRGGWTGGTVEYVISDLPKSK